MLSFKYVPYRDHSSLNTDQKLNKIFSIVRRDKIVLMQGKLKPHEEAKLIEKTMGQITKEFPGISFCTVYPNGNNKKRKGKKKNNVAKAATSAVGNIFYKTIMGKRDCLTIVGPANIVKDIRKNPSQIDLFING
jgi:hypothetical protein